MKAAIFGVTGYAGLELFRLLVKHPEITDIIPVSSSQASASVLDMDAGIDPSSLEKVKTTNGKLISPAEYCGVKADVLFSALPHVESAKKCAEHAGKTVIVDLSADFRFKDLGIFEKTYKTTHPAPDLAKQSVYGLTEWYREKIKKTDLIGNPGCYPTATLLPLLPLLKEGIIGGRIIANAISGISGAGKKIQLHYLFSERTENAGAYSPGTTHRHLPEIEQEIHAIDHDATILFTPHLAPMKRGMTVSTVAPLLKEITASDAAEIYKNYYGTSPFIRLTNSIPQSGDVWGSNRCDICFHLEEGVIMLFSAIDNLVKGASGAAVQNMNVRFGFDERVGLPLNSTH